MKTGENKKAWYVYGESIIGASHIAQMKENEDAVAFVSYPEEGIPAILAVSDGHGSSACFRSNIGSRLAVQAAVEQFKLFGRKYREEVTMFKHIAEMKLPQGILNDWRELVRSHIEEHPFSDAENDLLRKSEPVIGSITETDRDLLAYGTTLISAIITDTYVLYFQIGDGDILEVLEDGTVCRPFPKQRYLANETTSLCTSDAHIYIRIHFHAFSSRIPALILLATDGYSNSFVHDDGFMQVGSDLYEFFKDEGFSSIKDNLSLWLNETTHEGSGDDISVTFAVRKDLMKDAEKID